MKEAAGEANLTVITIILIGVVVAVATPLITSMMENTAKRSCCTNAGGTYTNSTCTINGAASTDYMGRYKQEM
jgi:hypothetical protein